MKPVNSGISFVGEGGASGAVGFSIVGGNDGEEVKVFAGDRESAAWSKWLACAGLSGEIDRARSESWVLVSRAPTSSGPNDLQSLTFSKCPSPTNVFFQGLNAFHVLLFSALLEFGDGSEERCSFVGHCLQSGAASTSRDPACCALPSGRPYFWRKLWYTKQIHAPDSAL